MSGVTIVSLKDCDLYIRVLIIQHVTYNISDEITLKLPADFPLYTLTKQSGSIVYSLPPVDVHRPDYARRSPHP